MYKIIEKISKFLDKYGLTPGSATERDQMLRWFPWPPLPGHVTRYRWVNEIKEGGLGRLDVWQEPVPGEGCPAAPAATAADPTAPLVDPNAGAGDKTQSPPAPAKTTTPPAPAGNVPPAHQSGTYVPALQMLSPADLETRAAELGVQPLSILRRKPAQLLLATAKMMAKRAKEADEKPATGKPAGGANEPSTTNTG